MPFAPEGKYGSDVVVKPLDAVRWQLMGPVCYVGTLDRFIIPENYVTDWATIPRVVVWLFPRFGNHAKAAILHDYLLTDAMPAGRVTSVDADGLFRRAMKELGVPPVKRWLMWTGVRWGALFNARRRDGWLRTAPAVLALSVPGLIITLIPAIANALGILAYGAMEFVGTRGRRKGTLKT